MAKFIINKNGGKVQNERTVEAEKYGTNDGFVHFTANGARVHSANTQYVLTIDRVDE